MANEGNNESPEVYSDDDIVRITSLNTKICEIEHYIITFYLLKFKVFT